MASGRGALSAAGLNKDEGRPEIAENNDTTHVNTLLTSPPMLAVRRALPHARRHVLWAAPLSVAAALYAANRPPPPSVLASPAVIPPAPVRPTIFSPSEAIAPSPPPSAPSSATEYGSPSSPPAASSIFFSYLPR